MPPKGQFKPHCLRGHQRTPENLVGKKSCRECRKLRRNRPRTPEQKAKHSVDQRAWAQKNPDSVLNTQLKVKYGITLAQYRARLEEQQHRCLICNVKFSGQAQHGATRPVVDHRHVDNAVRGILCSNCNCGIGLLRDDPNILRRAAEYIIVTTASYTHREAA